MLRLNAAVCLSGLLLPLTALPALAHSVVSDTFQIPSMRPANTGDTALVTIECPHGHYVVAGGYRDLDQLNGSVGPLEVIASFPSSTRSWSIELVNASGRLTGAQEASVTMYVVCDHHR